MPAAVAHPLTRAAAARVSEVLTVLLGFEKRTFGFIVSRSCIVTTRGQLSTI